MTSSPFERDLEEDFKKAVTRNCGIDNGCMR